MSKSFEEKKDAKKWADEQEAKIRSGGNVSRLPQRTTIAQVMNDYIAHLEERRKVRDERKALDPTADRRDAKRQYTCGALSHHLGDRTVVTLTANAIQSFIDKMLTLEIPPPANKRKTHKLYDGDRPRKYSAAAVRQHFYTLKVAMVWHAMKHEYSVAGKFDGLTIPGSWENPRERRLEKGEEPRLLEACNGMKKDPEGWKLLIGLALETAMRAQELLGMRWREVNLELQSITIPKEREKTRRGRVVPLSAKAIAILKRLKRRTKNQDERVFFRLPTDSVQLGRGVKRIAKRAGVQGFRFHDLRHEATSRFFERTALQTMEIAQITGHTDARTLQRYTHLRPAYLAAKLNQPRPIREIGRALRS
jgi:integrase